ncbi:MAG: oxidoreductase, partial [Bradymonadaceae bacterium]
LIYGSKDWESITFREELEELKERLPNLDVVHCLEKPEEGWEGEVGFVTPGLLERHLPPDIRRRQYFLCGPMPMLINVEKALREVGVPQWCIHAELFNLV